MKIGSLFSGYLGLDMAVSAHFNAETVWTSEIDPGASKIIAHRFDGPNHGDLTKINWSQVEPVDILTGGFPCQDLSHAGKRAGLRPGTRSGLWSHMAYAISQLRPRYVVAENVRGLLSAAAHSSVESCAWCVGGTGDGEPDLRALGCVLGDLAELGYDARWVGLPASDVGAPHGRFRVFVLAEDTDRPTGSERRLAAPRQAQGGRAWADTRGRGGVPAADTQRGGRDGGPHEPQRGSLARTASAGGGEGIGLAPDAGSERHGRGEDGRALGLLDRSTAGETREWERSREVAGDRGSATAADSPGGTGSEWDGDDVRIRSGAVGPESATGRGAVADSTSSERRGAEPEHLQASVGPAAEPGERTGATSWGDYAPAVQRWERVLGRPAPAPTETGPKGGQRLSPRFVEWMMGLPAGHVTDVPDLSRNAQLKALGNGVVPQQALRALEVLAA